AGRIVALADVFDALTSKRPYKEPFPVEESFAVIREERGRHFDPQVVDAFFDITDEILAIKNKYQEDRDSLLFAMVGDMFTTEAEKD
ncbi:MAG: HD-GYP domain-containing protein, partial [Acidobacteriota bacterium]